MRPTHLPYPPLARQARISGEVKLRIGVEQDDGSWGRPAKVEVIAGYPLLAETAREYAQSWNFWPRKGRTDWFFATVRFEFQEHTLGEHEKSPGESLGTDASFFQRPALVTVQGSPAPGIFD